MAGGAAMHSLASTNLTAAIKGSLGLNPSRCRAFNSDLRIRIPATGLRTYPDASVICGPIQYDEEDEEKTTATNPILIAEVLSPATEGYDRGKKFEHYQTLSSLRQYVLVSQSEPKIETYLRQSDGTWQYACISGLEGRAKLDSLNVELALAEV
jgi:Uma2 family endonuclease